MYSSKMQGSPNTQYKSQEISWQDHGLDILGISFFLALLYISRMHSYLLFHTLSEIFSIIVAFCIFMISWNSRRFLANDYLLFLGITFFFIGCMDIAHALTYKDMKIFTISSTANLSTQLWVSARGMQSIVYLAIPLLLIGKIRIKPYAVLFIFIFLSTLLFISIFVFKNFPDCYIEGKGLTFFKNLCEYIICVIFILSIVLFCIKRKFFEPAFFYFMVVAILFTIASEVSFTLYFQVDEIFNALGHIWKIVAYFFVYKAIIQLGLQKPYDLLFWNIKQSEESLKESEKKYRELVEDMDDAIVCLNEKGEITYISSAIKAFTDYIPEEMEGKQYRDFIHSDDIEKINTIVQKSSSGKFEMEHRVKTKSGEYHWVHTSGKSIMEGNQKTGFRGIIRDIAEWKKMQETLRNAERTQILIATAGAAAHEINQPLTAIAGFTELLLMRKTLDIYTREKLEKIYESSKTIDEILKKMQSIRHYVTKSYPCGQNIVDFDESANIKKL